MTTPFADGAVGVGEIGGLVGIIAAGLFGWLNARTARQNDVDKVQLRADLTLQNVKHDAEIKKVQADAALLKERGEECVARERRHEARERRHEARQTELEKALAELKARMSGQATATGFYVWGTADEKIIDVTDGVRAVLGWRPQELIGRTLDTMIPESVRSRHHAGVSRAVETGSFRSPDLAIKTQALRPDGGEVDVTVSLEPAPGRGPGVIRAEVIIRGGIVE